MGKHTNHKVRETGLLVEELSVTVWHIENADLVRVLRIIRKRENDPFLVHCSNGSDRPGAMIAMFRVVEQGWTKEDPIEEYGECRIWIPPAMVSNRRIRRACRH